MTTAQAVVYVRDLDAMAAFYKRCLATEEVSSGEGYRGLRNAGWTLWLLRGSRTADPNPGLTERPRPRSDVPLKLCFAVDSIDATSAAISESGGEVDARTWEFGGYLRRDAVDPEGNILQLLQTSPT